MGSHSLLQGIFLTQVSCIAGIFFTSHKGSLYRCHKKVVSFSLPLLMQSCVRRVVVVSQGIAQNLIFRTLSSSSIFPSAKGGQSFICEVYRYVKDGDIFLFLVLF